jgi:hypothetical protein
VAAAIMVAVVVSVSNDTASFHAAIQPSNLSFCQTGGLSPSGGIDALASMNFSTGSLITNGTALKRVDRIKHQVHPSFADRIARGIFDRLVLPADQGLDRPIAGRQAAFSDLSPVDRWGVEGCYECIVFDGTDENIVHQNIGGAGHLQDVAIETEYRQGEQLLDSPGADLKPCFTTATKVAPDPDRLFAVVLVARSIDTKSVRLRNADTSPQETQDERIVVEVPQGP